MSNATCESSTKFAEPSSKSSGAATSAPSGLDTILLAMQALKKEPRHQVEAEKSTLPTTSLPTSNFPATTSTNTPPIPHGINSARRVVSTDTIGDSDTDSTPGEHLPQVKEEETVSSSEKPLDAPSSAPLESGTSSSARSSPSPSSQAVLHDSAPSMEETSKGADFSHILKDPEGWLKETENLFAKLPPIDRSSDKEIVVQPNDVLCGRGGETNHHPGNIRYRSLVKAYQKLYLLAKRRDKPKIAQCIVVSVRGVDGRFLKRTKNANKGSAWVDVGNVKAREKTSQALREGAPNLRENVNPPVTGTSSDDGSAATNARQILASDPAENVVLPPSATPALATSTATPFQPMVGWNWQEAAKGASQPVPPLPSSAVPHASSAPPAPPASPLEAENEAYMKIFTKATAQLMQHPAFHQLDPARQYEAILYECNNARAAVESAKRSRTGNDQGRKSPMNPATAMKQQQAPQAQQHQQAYSYYNHGQHQYYPQMQSNYWPDASTSNPKAPAGINAKPDHALSLLASKAIASQGDKTIDPQSFYRNLLAAKAGIGGALSSEIKKEQMSTPDEQPKTKKRPVSSNAAVVSDTGSDASSSSSSSYESLLVSKDEKTEAVTSVSRGGSRLKRLKLRMKSDFN